MNEDFDPTYWFMFVPAIVLCVAPWLVGASFVLRGLAAFSRVAPPGIWSMSIAERFRIGNELREQHPNLAHLHKQAFRWMKITLITWVSVFFIMFAVAIICMLIGQHLNQEETGEPKAPNTSLHGSTESRASAASSAP